MWIVVGLGNPGPEYRSTRHNIGFRVVDELHRRWEASPERRLDKSLVAFARAGEMDIVLARPRTFMNRSGDAVGQLLSAKHGSVERLLVVCDDLYLDLGSIRLRARGSHGGHNGLRSIIGALATPDFPRLRLGIGPADAGREHADFVLQNFRAADRARVDEMIVLGADCAQAVVSAGLPAAMNRYNRRSTQSLPG